MFHSTNRCTDCLVEDPATGLHRPRNYMQTLEARIKYLETQLQRLHSEHFIGNGPAMYSDEIDPDFASKPSTSQGANHESSMDHLSSEVALLCLNAAGQEPRYFGPSSAVSFSHIASQTMGLRKALNASHIRRHPGVLQPQKQSLRTSFTNWPSADHGERLTAAYYHNIHPQYPFLHQPTLLRWQRECCVSRKGSSMPNSVVAFFVLMVYAIGSLTSDTSAPEVAELYYKAALDYLEPVLEIDGLESIQALLSIAVYSIRSPSGMSLWKVSGMTMRLCIQLGYHRSAEKYRPGGDAVTKEMSKRCFWVAYDLDRYVSCILGLPGAISDLSIDVEVSVTFRRSECLVTQV